MPTTPTLRPGLLMRVDCDPATGLPTGEPRIFVDHRSAKGYIDGSVLDRDGILWNACWGGSVVEAYSPDGKLVRTVAMPVTQPSCPAFVGKNADRLRSPPHGPERARSSACRTCRAA